MEIDPKATYTIVTIDYLLNLGSGNYSILQEGKNAKPLGMTLRDAVMDYVKAETAAGRPIKATLDGRFVLLIPTLKSRRASKDDHPKKVFDQLGGLWRRACLFVRLTCHFP